ncbi:MAG: DUF1385 domain-containing protein [Dehalococcoidales bacterium]|nr:DUF1385 domain-containing protein [Dehalococcoidales bacterium]
MAKRFYYGGQAVIDGVMMRGQKTMVTVVRRPSGELAMDIQPLAAIYTGWMRQAPLIRGIIVLIEVLVLGIKTLLYSANVSLEEEEERISGGLVWAIVAISLVLAVALFFIAPLFLTRLLNPYINSSLVFHLIEGFIRVAIFISYLKLVRLVPDIKRVFAYHGAEHKVVNAYEDGAPLKVDAARGYNTAHVRCGTSFLFAVLIIAILVFALVGQPSLWLMVLSRILLIPLITALGYEVIRFGADHTTNSVVRAILAPGLLLQALTTREPDDGQLEVALSALNKVVEVDQLEEAAQASSRPSTGVI